MVIYVMKNIATKYKYIFIKILDLREVGTKACIVGKIAGWNGLDTMIWDRDKEVRRLQKTRKITALGWEHCVKRDQRKAGEKEN